MNFDDYWTCPWCGVMWPDGDPLGAARIPQEVVGCPNCGNFESIRFPDPKGTPVNKKIILLGCAIVAALVLAAAALAETQTLLGTTTTSWPVQGELSPGYQNVFAWQFQASASKTTTTANFYFAAHRSTEVVGIYSDASGVPGTLLGSVSLGSSGTGWKVATFTGVSLTSGTSYWIAEDQTGNTGANSYPIDSNFDFTGCADQVNADRELSGQASLPATWPSVSNIDNFCPHGFVFKG